MEKIKSFHEEHERNQEIYINELLSGEVYDDNKSLMLHVKYGKDMSLSDKLYYLRKGFEDLANLIRYPNTAIERITATSWIVTENPGLLEKLGFSIVKDGEMVNKHKNMYLNNKKSVPLNKTFVQPSYAEISASDFIKRYSSK